VKTLELRRPREVGDLFRDAWAVVWSQASLFIVVSAAVAIPAGVIVEGIGQGMLTSSYDSSPSPLDQVIPVFVGLLVVGPIITAICIYALREVAAGARPAAGQVLVAGFEAFTPLFAAVVLAAAGVLLGLILFIVPGVFLAVRWYFVPQAVVIEGARGAGALSRSGQLVQGRWWRTLGLVALANLAVAIPGLLVLAPFTALADSTDRAVWELVGSIVATSITTPFLALYSTLLYYDLVARAESPYAGDGHGGHEPPLPPRP
jgi:hypothetical protein